MHSFNLFKLRVEVGLEKHRCKFFQVLLRAAPGFFVLISKSLLITRTDSRLVFFQPSFSPNKSLLNEENTRRIGFTLRARFQMKVITTEILVPFTL